MALVVIFRSYDSPTHQFVGEKMEVYNHLLHSFVQKPQNVQQTVVPYFCLFLIIFLLTNKNDATNDILHQKKSGAFSLPTSLLVEVNRERTLQKLFHYLPLSSIPEN